MNLCMAVQATTALPQIGGVLAVAPDDWHPDGTQAARYVRGVTLLAKQWRACLEHGRDRAAMRVVAN